MFPFEAGCSAVAIALAGHVFDGNFSMLEVDSSGDSLIVHCRTVHYVARRANPTLSSCLFGHVCGPTQTVMVRPAEVQRTFIRLMTNGRLHSGRSRARVGCDPLTALRALRCGVMGASGWGLAPTARLFHRRLRRRDSGLRGHRLAGNGRGDEQRDAIGRCAQSKPIHGNSARFPATPPGAGGKRRDRRSARGTLRVPTPNARDRGRRPSTASTAGKDAHPLIAGIARAARAGWSALRFNFRSVGKSEGRDRW